MVSYTILSPSSGVTREKQFRSKSGELHVIHVDGIIGMARVWINDCAEGVLLTRSQIGRCNQWIPSTYLAPGSYQSSLGTYATFKNESTVYIHLVSIFRTLRGFETLLTLPRSSALIPKPPDWGPYINITGFSFLSASTSYKPPDDLMEFLNAGPPPVYIGFGSIVVDEPNELTEMIFKAVKIAGVRALVSKGWGGLGGEEPPEGVFLLGNCPHDWLFNYVSAVVHHGGAGTTAIGIAMGKPTVVVPFFGDQPFWGAMIFRAGAGPEPVPYKKMTAEILAESITKALGPEIKTHVKEMSEKIANEHGAEDAAASFHQAVNMDSMRCLLLPERVAVWRIKKTNIRLSALAAGTLIDNGYFELSNVKL